MTKFEELKKQATVRVHSHGAFGEHESYDQLDVDKFYELVVLECVKEAKAGWQFNETAEYIKAHIPNCILIEMGLQQHCEIKGEEDVNPV